MNQSTEAFYHHLVTDGVDPENINTDVDGPAMLTADGTEYFVKKQYGRKIILHSDRAAGYLRSGKSNAALVIMPEDPKSNRTPTSVIPLGELGDPEGGIDGETIRERAPDGGVEYWDDTMEVVFAHREGELQVSIGGDLAERIANVAEQEPEFGNAEQAVRAACRLFVEEREKYSEAT